MENENNIVSSTHKSSTAIMGGPVEIDSTANAGSASAGAGVGSVTPQGDSDRGERSIQIIDDEENLILPNRTESCGSSDSDSYDSMFSQSATSTFSDQDENNDNKYKEPGTNDEFSRKKRIISRSLPSFRNSVLILFMIAMVYSIPFVHDERGNSFSQERIIKAAGRGDPHSEKDDVIRNTDPQFTDEEGFPFSLPRNKVSVVLMNYSRPKMIKQSSLLHTLIEHPNIDEILILHANEESAFNVIHPKVVNIDATKTYNEIGLGIRFYFCQMVKNEWVLHLHDNIEFPSETITAMLGEFSQNTRRIVGHLGQDHEMNEHNSFDSKTAHKKTDVISTKLMLMEREMCSSFFEYSYLVEDKVLSSLDGPMWNGEDIFMSLVANHVYCHEKNNYAMDWLDVQYAVDEPDMLKDYDNGKLDIHGLMKSHSMWEVSWWRSWMIVERHRNYRKELWEVAEERLTENVPCNVSI